MVLAFVALVMPACAQGGRDRPPGEADGGGQKGAREGSDSVNREPTLGREEWAILTGVITDVEGSCLDSEGPCGRILVEEDPDADCGGNRGPLASGCEKMYFDVTRETAVFRREGDTRRAASADDLHRGLRVSADYTGYDVAESYPSQTGARVVTILESPDPTPGGTEKARPRGGPRGVTPPGFEPGFSP